MNGLRLGLCLCAAAFGAATALAQRAVPANPSGSPTAPPGLSQPLPAGPFTYRTGEGQDIRVTVLARLPWPYALTFLPNGDLLIAQRTGEIKRMARGSTELRDVPGGPVAIGPAAGNSVHAYMGIAVHPRFAENGHLYIVYTKPLAESRRTTAVARVRYADGRLHDLQDLWVGENISGGPASLAMTPDAKLWIGTSGGFGQTAQDPATLAGKVLRLNDDGTVPADNPFVAKEGHRPEIYTMGHRTSLGLTVHPLTSQVFLAEMGPNGGDEVNLIKPGSNYGWPIVSHSCKFLLTRTLVANVSMELVQPHGYLFPVLAPCRQFLLHNIEKALNFAFLPGLGSMRPTLLSSRRSRLLFSSAALGCCYALFRLLSSFFCRP
jgi:glucose/arabinose dehydrogenase